MCLQMVGKDLLGGNQNMRANQIWILSGPVAQLPVSLVRARFPKSVQCPPPNCPVPSLRASVRPGNSMAQSIHYYSNVPCLYSLGFANVPREGETQIFAQTDGLVRVYVRPLLRPSCLDPAAAADEHVCVRRHGFTNLYFMFFIKIFKYLIKPITHAHTHIKTELGTFHWGPHCIEGLGNICTEF